MSAEIRILSYMENFPAQVKLSISLSTELGIRAFNELRRENIGIWLPAKSAGTDPDWVNPDFDFVSRKWKGVGR